MVALAGAAMAARGVHGSWPLAVLVGVTGVLLVVAIVQVVRMYR